MKIVKDDGTPEYNQPLPSSKTAAIKGSIIDPEALLTKRYLYVVMVDAKFVKRDNCEQVIDIENDCYNRYVTLEPGEHKISVLSIVSKLYTTTTIKFSAEPGHNYVIKGTADNGKFLDYSYNIEHMGTTSWIEDESNGMIVSEKIFAKIIVPSKSSKPFQDTLYMDK